MTRARNLAVARVRGAGQAIESTLRGYVKGFPSLDRLPAFYGELVDVLLDLGRLKKHLAALDWAADKVRDITRQYRGRIGRAAGNSISGLRREAYGRLSSVVNQIAPDLDALVTARIALRRVPEIDSTIPTIVVAGYPNVGKSSFVRAASSGRPKVASYAFTTKGVSLGHFDRGVHRYQILDTPGLLDRPMDKRNKMERQAIAALTHLANGVLFLLDPTETCGYLLQDQRRLLEEVRMLFPGVPLVVAATKSDLEGAPSDEIRVSAVTGAGVAEVLDLLLGRSPAAVLQSRLDRQRLSVHAFHREANAFRDLRDGRWIVEVGDGVDDRAAAAFRILGLEDPGPDEDPVAAHEHHQRSIGRRRDSARREVDDRESLDFLDLGEDLKQPFRDRVQVLVREDDVGFPDRGGCPGC